MKRIALIVPSIEGGGAEKVAADLSLYFARKGYEVFFLVRDMPLSGGYMHSGRVIQIPLTYNREKNIYRSLELLYNEADYLRKMKEAYQIDISISFMQSCNLLNILSRVDDKIIVSLHSVVSERKETFGNIATNKWVFRYVYQMADHIIFVSEYCRKDWIRHYGDMLHKSEVLYNPIGQIRSSNKIDSKKYGMQVIISVARMDRIKRPWHIVRMFSRVLSVYPQAQLLMLGDGELLSVMRKLAKEMGMKNNVHFLGNVENVDDYLDIAKVFVLASASESFGCSVVEAMRSGVPIVANYCPGGIKEILDDKCGIITSYLRGNQHDLPGELSKEEDEMADAVIRVLSDNILYDKLSRACKKEARQFDLNKVGLLWEKKVIAGEVKNKKRKRLAAKVLGDIYRSLAGAGVFCQNIKNRKKIADVSTDKFADYFNILDKWMCLKEEGKSVEPYFIRRGYKKIAIYGMGKMGKHLMAELENSSIEVVYGIDRRAEFLYTGIPILDFAEEWQSVDAIVITVTIDYENISKQLQKKINCPAVNLRDVIFDTM